MAGLPEKRRPESLYGPVKSTNHKLKLMQDFDKHIKNMLENPPKIPANEQVWKKVQRELHPGRFSWDRLWWLLPLAMAPIAALALFLTGSSTNNKTTQTNSTSVVIKDTIYQKTVILTYDTIYHHTVIVEKTNRVSNPIKPYTIYSWQLTPPQGFGSLAPFMRSDFRSLESFPRWGSLRREGFFTSQFTSTMPAQATQTANAKEEGTLSPGLRSTATLKNKYFSAIFSDERMLHAASTDLLAIQTVRKQSQRRARLLNAADQAARAIAPDVFGFGFSTSAEMHLDGSLQERIANANGLTLYLDLNPRIRLVGGIELLSVNYNEIEADHFSRYPYVAPPVAGGVLTRIEPYLTYYRLPLGMELRLYKRERTLEPYAQTGFFWTSKSGKNYLEYYFTDPQTGAEHIRKYPTGEETQHFPWLPGSWWASAGFDWYPFSSHRNLFLRGQATYVQYAAGLEPKLNFKRSLGLRASLSYTLPFH